MRVLLHTPFYPNVGGIETVASLLAHEWSGCGVELTVVSDVACSPELCRGFPFPVVYRPSVWVWLQLIHFTDVFVHMNISLKALWPLMFCRRPFVAVHHGFYECDRTGRRDWREKLKLRVMQHATNIAVSKAVAKRIAQPAAAIPNPVDTTLFHPPSPSTERARELVFVGRLVSDKGVNLLLTALTLLRQQRLRPLLTIIGDGPERAALERRVQTEQLTGQVRFTEALDQSSLALELRQHHILVVPSLWEEPFGVVALEGAASGCLLLGSDGGGLPEAIGPAGITFRRGDPADLAAKLAHLLVRRDEWAGYRAAAPAHLAAHQPAEIALRYLQVFAESLKR